MRTCKNCGVSIEHRWPNAKYCSRYCREYIHQVTNEYNVNETCECCGRRRKKVSHGFYVTGCKSKPMTFRLLPMADRVG